MSDHIDFDKIVQEFRGAYHEGQLKFQSSSFTFKNRKTNRSEQVQNENVENLYWLKRAKGNCFKVVLKSGSVLRFDGFLDADYAKLDEYASRTMRKSVEKCDLSVKGWNWGKPNFVGDAMQFEADGKIAFDVPLRNVSNTNAGKNEAILQFHQNEDAAISLMEIRFHIPTPAAPPGVDATDAAVVDPAQEFVQRVLAKADIQHASDADAICTLTELNCITPRGRYDVKFFTDFVDLHGKTFDYKISYEHITRLFLLPHKDGRQMYFVIAMDPPMKQGNTRYPFLIVLFNIEEEIEVELTISEKTKEKFGDRIERLDSVIKGPIHEVVSRICRTVLDKKITVPGTFTTASGAKCYSCSFKASSGFLYPLERGFIFVNKPPLHLLFSDITFVKFDRSQQGTRSFDFEIEHKNGSKHVFNGIEKTEQEKLQEFVKSKGINIAKSSKAFSTLKGGVEDNAHDAYAERMKAEGREKDEESSGDDEEDADFQADSESDDDIEYDSDASISGSGESGSGSGSGSGSDDDDGEKKTKKKEAPVAKKPAAEKSTSKKPAAAKRPSDSKTASAADKSKKPKADAVKSSDNKTVKSAEFVEDDDTESD